MLVALQAVDLAEAHVRTHQPRLVTPKGDRDMTTDIEHISSRALPDDTWHDLEANLGVDHHNRQRFHAAQRTCALRWLAVLWKQRQRRAEEFTVQLDRVRQLQN